MFNLSTAPGVESKYLGEHPLAMPCVGMWCCVVTAAEGKEQTDTAHMLSSWADLWSCRRATGWKGGMECPGSLLLDCVVPWPVLLKYEGSRGLSWESVTLQISGGNSLPCKRWNLNRLPREVVDAPSLAGWGSEQPDLVGDVSAHCRRAQTRWPLKVPSNPNCSISAKVLWKCHQAGLGTHYHIIYCGDGLWGNAVSWHFQLVLALLLCRTGISGVQGSTQGY